MPGFRYDSTLGTLEVAYGEAGVRQVRLRRRRVLGALPAPPDALGRRIATELDQYFSGRRRRFDLPLAPEGTAYQKRVWRALAGIAYGETRTYGEVAADVASGGRASAARAVGQAVGRNPIAVLIPCHRVVAAGGKLGGYSGGLEIKQRLLDLERAGSGGGGALVGGAGRKR